MHDVALSRPPLGGQFCPDDEVAGKYILSFKLSLIVRVADRFAHRAMKDMTVIIEANHRGEIPLLDSHCTKDVRTLG